MCECVFYPAAVCSRAGTRGPACKQPSSGSGGRHCCGAAGLTDRPRSSSPTSPAPAAARLYAAQENPAAPRKLENSSTKQPVTDARCSLGVPAPLLDLSTGLWVVWVIMGPKGSRRSGPSTHTARADR